MHRERLARETTTSHLLVHYNRAVAKDGVQWQLNGNYCLTCIPGRVAARSNRHGNCATATVNTVVLRKFQAACVSKIIDSEESTTFLPYSLMRETECNGGCFVCFTAGDVNCNRSIAYSEMSELCKVNDAIQ